MKINIVDFFNNTSDEMLISLIKDEIDTVKLMCYALSLELQLQAEGKTSSQTSF
jgi:hypothetical protein